MAIESAAELSVFLEPTEFGVTASYTPVTGGSAVSVSGIFDAAFQSIEIGLEVPVATVGPQIVVRTQDLTNNGRQGDTFVIDGTTYKAIDVQPDGTGMTTVKLEKQ